MKPVTPGTRIGDFGSVRAAAALGRFDIEGCILAVEEMLRCGVLRWVRGENRVVGALRLVHRAGVKR